MRKYIIDNIINYLSNLSVITLQKLTCGKNINVSKNVKSRYHVFYISMQEDMSLQLLGRQTR